MYTHFQIHSKQKSWYCVVNYGFCFTSGLLSLERAYILKTTNSFGMQKMMLYKSHKILSGIVQLWKDDRNAQSFEIYVQHILKTEWHAQLKIKIVIIYTEVITSTHNSVVLIVY